MDARPAPPAPGGDPGAALLAEACRAFGIDPDPRLKPRQLIGWRYDPGEPDGVPPTPPSVVIVTGGGRKLRWPLDQATIDQLHTLFGTRHTDPRTGEVVEAPLPESLDLPQSAKDGIVRAQDHRYPEGYLRRPRR